MVPLAMLVFLAIVTIIPFNIAKNSPKEDTNIQTPVIENTTGGDSLAADSREIQRIKLEAGACVRSDQVLEDSLAWLEDTEEVKAAMDYFYDKTGIQPYLLICDGIDGKGGEITDAEAEIFLQELYESLYDDEGHMIFVFMEYEESEYVTFLYTGVDANNVMDADAREIFLANADWYYTDSSLSDEAYFAKIFRDSADDIMGK